MALIAAGPAPAGGDEEVGGVEPALPRVLREVGVHRGVVPEPPADQDWRPAREVAPSGERVGASAEAAQALHDTLPQPPPHPLPRADSRPSTTVGVGAERPGAGVGRRWGGVMDVLVVPTDVGTRGGVVGPDLVDGGRDLPETGKGP